MNTTTPAIDAAAALATWFDALTARCNASLFAVGHDEPHRQAAALGVLCRHAKSLVASELDLQGALYAPLCFLLAAACRRLDLHPRVDAWRLAIENVRSLTARLRELAPGFRATGLGTGSAAEIFKTLLDEALIHAGVTDQPTILDHLNRGRALGLAVNWGMRLLLAYALEVDAETPRRSTETQDLVWIRDLVAPLTTTEDIEDAQASAT